LWRELAASRRAQRARPADSRAINLKVEELAAQIDYMREEIESLRGKKRR
jgi:hypothetical protein